MEPEGRLTETIPMTTTRGVGWFASEKPNDNPNDHQGVCACLPPRC